MLCKHYPRHLLALHIALICLSLGACSGEKKSSLPTTFAVRGKVVYQEDGKPLVDGAIQFEPIDSPIGSVAIVGTTQSDGRYEISTIRDNEKVTGAPEGSYRIRISPRMGADQQDNTQVLPGPYKIEPREENTLDLTLPGKAPSP